MIVELRISPLQHVFEIEQTHPSLVTASLVE